MTGKTGRYASCTALLQLGVIRRRWQERNEPSVSTVGAWPLPTSTFATRWMKCYFASSDGPAMRELKRWKLLARAARDFDIIHFNFGTSILPRYMPNRHDDTRPARTVLSADTW
jgi:hypothetical protein